MGEVVVNPEVKGAGDVGKSPKEFQYSEVRNVKRKMHNVRGEIQKSRVSWNKT